MEGRVVKQILKCKKWRIVSIILTYAIVWCLSAFLVRNEILTYESEIYIYNNTYEDSLSAYETVALANQLSKLPIEIDKPAERLDCHTDTEIVHCDNQAPIIGIPLVTVMLVDFYHIKQAETVLRNKIEANSIYIDSLLTRYSFEYSYMYQN